MCVLPRYIVRHIPIAPLSPAHRFIRCNRGTIAPLSLSLSIRTFVSDTRSMKFLWTG